MVAGAPQHESLYIKPSSPTEMCFQIAAPVCLTLFVAPEDGSVFHASLPCNSICPGGKAIAVNPLEVNGLER